MAELVFQEENFAKCATKQDLGIEGFTRSCKGGKGVVVGGCSVNMNNMLEKDGNVGSSKGKARNSEPLERCNRVYAQPYYVLRKTKFYAAVKKGVCAPSYVIPKLYLNL